MDQARLLLLAVTFCAVIFILDLRTELGVAGAVPYAAVLLVMAWSKRRSWVVAAAVACTLLTVIGFFGSPPGLSQWKGILNRSVAIGVIWTTAVVVMLRMREEMRRRAVEARLLMAQRLESLGRIAGGVAHDFNNLLLPILTLSQMARERADHDDELKSDLVTIESAARQASQLVQQMLLFAGRAPYEHEPVELSSLVEGMRGLLRHAVRDELELKYELGPDLSSVGGDASQVRQIVMNLTLNAADAYPPGRTGTVVIRTSQQVVSGKEVLDPAFVLFGDLPIAGAFVCLEVEDQGIGMDPVTRARLFEPFFTTKASGHGLGMSVVASILRTHKAHMMVRSEPGNGTSIRILLPVDDGPKLS